MMFKWRRCYLVTFLLILIAIGFRLHINLTLKSATKIQRTEEVTKTNLGLGAKGNPNVNVDKKANKADLVVTSGFEPQGGRKRIRILLYTPLFGGIPWKSVPFTYNFTTIGGSKCPVSSCELIYDKSQLHSSDLVVFHGRDLPNPDHLRSISNYPQRRKQVWLYFMHESPWYSYTVFPPYAGFFNWTASYRPDSDILVAYHYYRALRENEPGPPRDTNFAQGKKNRVSFVNSHCDNDRMRFITEFRKHTQVDVYGACAQKFSPKTRPCPRSKECDKIQEEYKFYLAIENSFCTGYITEKYWLNGLNMGLVPIVMGGADYSDSRITIPGSYIDVRDFKSLKQLGDYINYLDKNDTAYNAYHQWRFKYTLHVDNSMCLFCKAAHLHKVPEKTVDLEQFWGKHNCDIKKPFLNALIKDSIATKP